MTTQTDKYGRYGISNITAAIRKLQWHAKSFMLIRDDVATFEREENPSITYAFVCDGVAAAIGEKHDVRTDKVHGALNCIIECSKTASVKDEARKLSKIADAIADKNNPKPVAPQLESFMAQVGKLSVAIIAADEHESSATIKEAHPEVYGEMKLAKAA